MKHKVQIRKAVPEDIPEVHALIKELAEFEKAPEEVTNSIEDMIEDGFGENPAYACLVAVDGDNVLGIALYFISYSTWKGKCVYLDDLVVNEPYRGQGIGKALLDRLVEEAKTLKAKKLHWQVLDWNEPAIRFYEKLDAELDGEWINVKLGEDGLRGYE